MKKVTVFAVFAAACLSAAAVDHTSATDFGGGRQNFAMQKAGAEHSMLRPQNMKLPQGYTTLAQRREKSATNRINNNGYDPDAHLTATNWSVLEHEDGCYWFFTQEFNIVNDWYYGGSDVTVYNDKLEKQATIHIDAPAGETCNSIVPFGMVTRKFFNINDKDWEMMVYVHCITADYTGKNYIYVINNNGDVIDRFDGYSAQFLDYGLGYNAQRRLLVGGEDLKTGKYSVDVYKKAGWGTGASQEHHFELSTELTNYSDGPAVNAFTIDNEPYYTLSHYEKPYVNGYDNTGSPTVTPNNNYIVEVYNGKFEKIAQVSDPVAIVDKGYSMRTFGYFSYDDLNRSYNLDGSKKLDIIITDENYVFDASDDMYLYGWSVYNEDGQKINEMGGRTIDWWELNPIKDQPDQLAMYTLDEEGAGHIEVYELPSCELVTGFDDSVEGLPISTAFDRVPTPDGFDYITSINQGFLDEEGNIIGVVAWITPDGALDKRVDFNLGPNAQYFTAAFSPLTLNPYVFNTDDGMEYLYRVKVARKDGTEALDDVIVIADSEGNTIRRFSSDNIYTTLSSCDVLYGADNNPFFLISYYASAYDDHFGESDINIYTLPFAKWPNGGSGTQTDPYHIASAGDLMHVADKPNGYYVVDNDIDFSALADGWTAIPEFTGHIDGNNHVFRNFYVSKNTKDYYSGLFGMVNGASISNIVFDQPRLDLSPASNYAGVVAGFSSNNTSVSRVGVFNPVVTGDNYTGQFGVIASYAGADVLASECFVEAADINLPNTNEVGGIFGFATAGSKAKACTVKGRITGHSAVGGIIGSTYVGSLASDCHANVDLTAHHYVGGIVGDSEKRYTVEHNYAEGTVRATGTDRDQRAGAGGIIGYVEPYWQGENDNAIAARYNLSAVNVEKAGTNASIHRIIGSCANDYPWTEEDIRKGKTFREAGVLQNYSTAPEAAGMELGPNETDGQSVDANLVNQAFLTKNLEFKFGNTLDAPWTIVGGKLCLYSEGIFTGMEGVLVGIDAAQTIDGTINGIYDLQGRRHESITTPGIYVIDGKKIVVE